MTNVLSHPSSTKLLDELRVLFTSDDIKVKSDRRIIFVCGGRVARNSHSMRHRFIKFAVQNLEQYRFLLVETAMKDLSDNTEEPEFINIASFEELVADLTDCLLIFPESPGSIAELAYFSNTKAAKKMLVVNDVNLQGESFINLGPIDIINKESSFKPALIMDYKTRPTDYSGIEGKLSRLSVSYSKKLKINSKDSPSAKTLLYVIYEIISIFQYITIESILQCIKKLFGKSNKEMTRYLLSILIASKYVHRSGEDNDFFSVSEKDASFLQFKGASLDEIKASVILYYQKYHPEIYSLIGEAA